MPHFDFDSIAERYDDWYANEITRKVDELEKAAVFRVLPKPSEAPTLLEVGCGTGRWMSWFAELGYLVTGLDPSSKSLEIARKKSIPGAAFRHGWGEKLVFPDSTFDITTAITSLEFADDERMMLREMVRCTKPGGTVLVAVLNRWSWYGLSRRMRRTEIARKAHFFSLEELKSLLDDFGESKVIASAHLIPLPFFDRFADNIEKFFSSMRSPFGSFLVGKFKV